jgi:hypothetical protein
MEEHTVWFRVIHLRWTLTIASFFVRCSVVTLHKNVNPEHLLGISVVSFCTDCVTHEFHVYGQEIVNGFCRPGYVSCRSSVGVTSNGLSMLTFSLDFPKEMDAFSGDFKMALKVLKPPLQVGELRDDSDTCGKQSDVAIRFEVN